MIRPSSQHRPHKNTLNEPPLYARFQLQTAISYGGAIITYAINPDGSRNLEPK